jgi:hypothetical protein
MSSLRTAPFIKIALLWLALASAIIGIRGGDARAFGWLAGIWALSLADLYALARTVDAALGISASSDQEVAKRAALSIQALFWGTIKLVCLASLGYLLLVVAPAIPQGSLLLGLGTLVIVSLGGGLLWSNQEAGTARG